MMTKSWTPSPYVAPEFSASELSIADAATLTIGTGAPSKVTLVTGVYAAVTCFKQGIPFELWCERSSGALLRYDGTTITAADAIRVMVSDVENIISASFQAGAQSATQS